MNYETTPPLCPKRHSALSEFSRCLEARIQMLRVRNFKRLIVKENIVLSQIEEIVLANGQSAFGALPGAQWRHHPLPAGQELMLNVPDTFVAVHTLDELSDAINFIPPEVFQDHVNAERNDFADWVETCFGLPALAEKLRVHPEPLRMMISIEKFLRQAAISY